MSADTQSHTNYQNDPAAASNLSRRHLQGRLWSGLFLSATILSVLALSVLILTIIDDTFGYAAIEYEIHPSTITAGGVSLEQMTCEQILPLLTENLSKNRLATLEKAQPILERSNGDCREIVIAEIAEPEVQATWSLFESITGREEIAAELAERYPEADLVFKSWLSWDFITSPQSNDPLQAGIRTAILGSLFVILVVVLVALPIGVAAAIYLEEYAAQNWLNRVIQTNINNLAGVPSIIYGMLGLAFFVRALEPLTSGAMFGASDPTTANGRTIFSAGLTLALLILPVVIINSQEAIRAVSPALREASYGMGATKWQTIWHHVLPGALPGILTGTILSVSRAFGETAPLVVVGAATYLTFDPTSLFAKFTTVPIQIYQWTARPQDAFRNIAAAAIVVLLILLLTLNAAAILLRNRYSRRV